MAAASAQALRDRADAPASGRLDELLEAVGAPPRAAAWPAAGAAEHPAPAPLFRPVPRALQERRSDNWLAWNVGRVRPDPFAILFERHWRTISAFCLTIVGSREEAEDAAAEAMSRAYATLSRREERPEFRPWIHSIARNASLDRIRQRNRGPQFAGAEEALEVPLHETPDDVLGRRDGLQRLVDDLQALSERQRAAIVMRELSGMSHGEIGAALDTTAARSQALVADAREALADRRAGRESRCGEYRRAADERGRLPRGHRFSAHRAVCPDCSAYARPRLLSGVFFLPAIELFVRTGRRVADVAGPALSGAGPGAAKVAAAAAVVAMAVPAAQPGGAAEQRAPLADGVAAAHSVERAPAARSPRARDEGASRHAARPPRERADIRSRRPERDGAAAVEPASPVAADGEAGRTTQAPAARPPAARPPATDLPGALRHELERIAEPVRRQAGGLVEDLQGAVGAPGDGPTLPGTDGVEEIVRGIVPAP